MSEYEVVWPRSHRVGDDLSLASRLGRMDGARIAFVWDYMFRGEEIFPIIERELTRRFDGMSFVGPDAFGSTHGDDEHQVVSRLGERLRELEVDAVVSGMGC